MMPGMPSSLPASAQQLVRPHEAVVLEIMRFHERRRGQGARRVQRIEIEPRALRRVFGENALGVVPGARGRAVHRRIGIEDAAQIGIQRLPAFFRRQHARGNPRRGRDRSAAAHRGMRLRSLCARAEKRRAQHDAADALGMGLRIGQRQRRAPGAADHHPALEAKFLADHLHVRDQMRQRVVLAAALRAAAAGAALIEQHGMKALGIEQPAMIGLAAAAGPAMQIDRGDAIRAADALDIDLVAVADRQHLARSAAQRDRRV